MWWHDLLWGFWNGFTAWIVWFAHLFGWWESQPFYDVARSGGWYDLGFLCGAGSPFMGAFGRRTSDATQRAARERRRDERGTMAPSGA